MTRTTVTFRAVTGAALALLMLAACAAQEVEVREPRVRDLIPGRDTTAGYFELTNNSSRNLILTGARSPDARAIEMHETIAQGDRVGMRRLAQVSIAPGETFAFAPGGAHLMIFGVEQVSEHFTIELQFDQHAPLTVEFARFGP